MYRTTVQNVQCERKCGICADFFIQMPGFVLIFQYTDCSAPAAAEQRTERKHRI